MMGDLGAAEAQVHAQARVVLDFWFALAPERHFEKDAALDREIADRFGAWVEALNATEALYCWDDPDTLLGAVVALDQFSRNIHRGTAAAFAADDLARWLALHAIGKGWCRRLSPERRVFLYMSLMHAEDRGFQALSVGLFERLGDPHHLAFARDHRDVIVRFGRFPSRNAALGRVSTDEEGAYLSQPGAGW